jgi:hypothetical protein
MSNYDRDDMEVDPHVAHAEGVTSRRVQGWPYSPTPPVTVTPPPDLKQALDVRDALFAALREEGWSGENFDGLDATELAEWLIRSGWVKGMP